MLNKLLMSVIAIVLSFLYAYYKKKNDKKYKIFMFFLILFFTITATFREFLFDDFGKDYFEYKFWFNRMNFSKFNFEYENVGFNLMICLIKLCSNNFFLFLFIFYFIMNFLLIKFIDNCSEDVFLSNIILISLFLFSTYNGMRQWFACAILLYSMKYIFAKSFYKFIFCVFIASLFHVTALIFFIFYPLFNINIKFIKKEIFLFIFGIIFYLNSSNLLIFLLENSASFGIDYLTKYNNVNGDVANYTCLIINTFIIVAYNMYLYIKRNDKNFDDICKYGLFTCVSLIMCLLSTKSFLFNRISIYFLPSIIISLPVAVNIFEKNSKFMTKTLITLLLLISFFT